MNGASIIGGNGTTRAPLDYYATPFHTTRALLEREPFVGSVLEPAAGEGHIVKVIREHYPGAEIIATDLVDRGDPFGVNIRGGR